MSLERVLWIVGTALAASSDDPRLLAATDGTSVWVTADAGKRWRHVLDVGSSSPECDVEVDVDDEDVCLDDLDRDPAAPPAVRALAIVGDTLLVATEIGVAEIPVDGGAGHTRWRSGYAVDTLAVAGRTVYATMFDTIVRSDDQGRRFEPIATVPGGRPARSLAASPDALLVATDVETFLLDLRAGRIEPLACGPSAVAASADGSLWRAGARAIERSRDGGVTWEIAWSTGARAVAVGASEVWIATGRRVAPARPAAYELDPTSPPLRLSDGQALALGWSSRAWWRSGLPRLTARVAATRDDASDGAGGGVVIEVLLTWELDAPPGGSR